MRNRHLILLLSILLATFLVAGCGGTRQATKAETDQFNAISGKIAEAENMTPKGAKECAPKELAVAKAELDGVRHQATEDWDDSTKTGPWSDSTIDKASKAADAVLAKTKACQPPIVNYSAAPETIAPGQCSTLTWSSQNVAEGGDRSGGGSRGCERLQAGVPHRNHPVHVDGDRDRWDRLRDGNRHGEGSASSSSSAAAAPVVAPASLPRRPR